MLKTIPAERPPSALTALREARKLSQGQMAVEIGISPSALCSAETGTRFPEKTIILKIMRYSINRKTGKPTVDANDLLRIWCARNGEEYPGG